MWKAAEAIMVRVYTSPREKACFSSQANPEESLPYAEENINTINAEKVNLNHPFQINHLSSLLNCF